ETALFGDLTFTYRIRNGRTVSYTVPFGLSAPSVDRCTNSAARLAGAQAEQRQADSDDEDQDDAATDAEEEEDATLLGTGSGFSVDRLGHVLTNAHVAGKCKRVTSEGLGEAHVVAVDEDADLALLKFSRPPRS